MRLVLRTGRMRAARRAWAALPVAAILAAALAPATALAQKWTVYEDCKLVANPNNDGDSFHVKAGRRTYIFRLYFVDAPETSRQVTERVTEQTAHWKVSESDVLAGGEAAKRFAEEFLKEPFTVYTRREDARGRSEKPRYYAFVRAGGRWLCEALIDAGWARSFGMFSDLPDGSSGRAYRRSLDQRAIKARQNGLGMWAGRREGLKALLERAAVTAERRVLTRGIAYYTHHATPAYAGRLPAGAAIEVVEAVTPMMLLVRFDLDGERIEAQCRRTEIMAGSRTE